MEGLYLRRKIDDFLVSWKAEPGHKPLLVRGPGQVGKTASVMRFARANYENVIYINFAEAPRYRHIAENGCHAGEIVKNISRMDPSKRFEEGRTLLFFDELQEFPEIAAALKSFMMDGRFDVICSGFLPEPYYKRIASESADYRTDYPMSSLDFEEFLWAKGYGAETVRDMLAHMLVLRPFRQEEFGMFSELFLDYCILGGMPDVVRQYIERGTFEGTLAVQRRILEGYREDIRRYARETERARILNVFDQIPVQLAKDNKKFQISKTAPGARFRDYRSSIEWLRDGGLIRACHCLDFPQLPLNGTCGDSKFKLYFFDTGLLVAMLDEEAQEELRANRNLAVYRGALYENLVGEALAKSGYALFYYKRENSTLEEDFFVGTRKQLLPVEVKAAKGTAKALRTLIESDKYPDISFGIRLTGGNIGYRDRVFSFPYFCAFLLKEYLRRAAPETHGE